MDQLPDNVLVLVLQHVEVRDLFTCRLVCKRLGRLAMLPDVWRHQNLHRGSAAYSPALVSLVLRLAPRLRLLYVRLSAEKRYQWAYASTRCAVAKLRLKVGGKGATGASDAAAMICRQEMLGRLESIHIGIHIPRAIEVPTLWGTLASTSRLKSLRVIVQNLALADWTPPITAAPVLSTPVLTSSLGAFRSDLLPGLTPYASKILAGHAPTLERVVLKGGAHSMTSTTTASLLAAMPNLKVLECCNLPGLSAVAACELLEVLHLTIRTEIENRPHAAEAAKLLLRSKHLRDVRLEYAPAISSTADVGADIVLALASSGSPLEKLAITNKGCGGGHFPQMYPLMSALPRLGALRRLQVDAQADFLLLAITPTTAPALEQVDVSLSDGVCAHAWCHGDAVKTAVPANPSLHIRFKASTVVYCGENSCAEACSVGCHTVLRDRIAVNGETCFLLFSHDTATKCSLDHTTDGQLPFAMFEKEAAPRSMPTP
ncbi:uncharacterized protein LOC113215176 isoform X1 [Frankliniella occidentalis]|uniref:Uncharacterized protein LOC113215176 isoform X1 n=1 Tax=Frankliniella occidentalis TaxID=133901 RepID=A0A6J1TCR2_FRAOC|nr:uncharacterized protein LOC113215176 isoform X1 [Frankliniella occidentalis]